MGDREPLGWFGLLFSTVNFLSMLSELPPFLLTNCEVPLIIDEVVPLV